MEEQLAKVRVQDLLLESVAGIVNLTARRIAKEDERDLEQARIGIEAVRAVVDLLEPEPAKAVREALAELQVLFARESAGQGGGSDPQSSEARSVTGSKGSDPGSKGSDPESPDPEPPASSEPPPRRPGEPPPRLWTPPGSS